jgi:uncharacterized membrane protein (UPF0127 family)
MKITKPKLCNTVFSLMSGLMFSRKKTILIDLKKPKRVGLHMWFVFFPINVYFLDENKKIVEIKERFLPFTFYNSKEKARYIVESPEKLEINIGEDLVW